MRVSGRVPSKGNGLGGNVDRVDGVREECRQVQPRGTGAALGRVMAREGKCDQGAGTAGGNSWVCPRHRCCQGGP